MTKFEQRTVAAWQCKAHGMLGTEAGFKQEQIGLKNNFLQLALTQSRRYRAFSTQCLIARTGLSNYVASIRRNTSALAKSISL